MEIAVFYDFDEQYEILGSKVEDYLAPIYKSEAQFVVPIVSSDYSTKLWTKFESDQFKDRIGENRVLPMRMSDVSGGLFDKLQEIGSFTYNVAEPATAQLNAFAEMLARKLVAMRPAAESISYNGGSTS